ncbi:MAG: D-amino-acid transaminase [Sedimenticola sp.]
MSRIVYVNGEYLAEDDAKISVFDRGFLFADGVYEVSSVVRGRLIDNQGHLKRLKRSLNELNLTAPAGDAEIETIQKSLIEKNGIMEGLVYLQATRGAADRDFAYPQGVKPSLVVFTQKKNLIDSPQAEAGISVITTPDIRWLRRDIKTVGLLAPCMAKMEAVNAGADDAWMVEHGYVTEGSSNNAYIIKQDGTLVTRQLGTEILSGITRQAVLKLAAEAEIQIEERPFTVKEAYDAAEAFVTSATTFVMPVISIDGKKIGEGRPGALSRKLRKFYINAALESVAD